MRFKRRKKKNGFDVLADKPAKQVQSRVSIEEARNMIEDLNRKPFMDFLSLLIGHQPTAASIQAFADQNPDKWASAISVFSKLSGYREEVNVNLNLYAAVKVMSDMDLENHLRQINKQIGDTTLLDPAIELIPPPSSSIPNVVNARKKRVIHKPVNPIN